MPRVHGYASLGAALHYMIVIMAPRQSAREAINVLYR